MAIRTYETGDEKFVIRMSGTPSVNGTAWEVLSVLRGSEEIPVPGLDSIVASTDDVAYARACDCIDKFLASRS